MYKKSHGFDYGFYVALQNQATFFIIEPLKKLTQEQSYLRAVVIHYSVTKMKGEHPDVANIIVKGNVEREFHPL